jgi:hypothetical protein
MFIWQTEGHQISSDPVSLPAKNHMTGKHSRAQKRLRPGEYILNVSFFLKKNRNLAFYVKFYLPSAFLKTTFP